MTHRVIEEFTLAKTGDGNLNEDIYVVTENIVAIFDGETDKRDNSRTNSGSSPGRTAAHILAEAVVGLPDRCDPIITVKSLSKAIASIPSNDAGFVAVGAVFDLRSQCVVRVGDISVGINGVFDSPHKRIDEVAGLARTALLESELRAGATLSYLRDTDPGRQMILPLLRAADRWRNQSNSEYGFGAFDGQEIPVEFIDVFEIPSGSDVVLASDGYDDPRPTLAESEELLAESIRRDPLRLGPPPGTKGVHIGHCSFDDRTYVRIKL